MCSCARAIAPPSIFLCRLVEQPETIHQSGCFPPIHPLAFLRQEAAHADLPFGMIDVDRVVTDVIIPANYDVRTCLTQFVYPKDKILKKLHLKLLPNVACRSARHIHIHYRHIPEIGAQHASFAVVARHTHTRYHLVRLFATEDRHTRIAFLFCRVDITVIAQLMQRQRIYLFGLCF